MYFLHFTCAGKLWLPTRMPKCTSSTALLPELSISHRKVATFGPELPKRISPRLLLCLKVAISGPELLKCVSFSTHVLKSYLPSLSVILVLKSWDVRAGAATVYFLVCTCAEKLQSALALLHLRSYGFKVCFMLPTQWGK